MERLPEPTMAAKQLLLQLKEIPLLHEPPEERLHKGHAQGVFFPATTAAAEELKIQALPVTSRLPHLPNSQQKSPSLHALVGNTQPTWCTSEPKQQQ